jgi:hypothetical protein
LSAEMIERFSTGADVLDEHQHSSESALPAKK